MEWLNPIENLDAEKYVSDLLDRMEKVNADTITYVIDNGGYLLYNGKTAPKDSHIGDHDLIGMLVEEAHERGLKFVASFLGQQGRTYLSNRYPHWSQLDNCGNPKRWYNFTMLCPNSPFGAYYVECIKEVISLYEVDGVYIEGIYFRPGYCYCDHCREAFRRRYDRDMPENNAENDSRVLQFRQDSITDFYRRTREVVDEVSPETVLIGTIYTLFEDIKDSDIKTFSKYVDVVAVEGQWGYYNADRPLREIGLGNLMLKAEGKKPVLNTQFIDKNVDYDYAPITEAHLKVAFMETLSQGAIVQVHTQNAFEEDERLMPALGALFNDSEKLRPYLTDATPLKWAAILDWASPTEKEDYFSDALKGFYLTLTEYHIPVNVVTPEDIELGALEDYAVLILPDARKLSRKTVDRIEAYARSGGGVVMTHQTDWEDDGGDGRLMTLLGVEKRHDTVDHLLEHMTIGQPECDKFLPHTYYRIDSDDGVWKNLNNKRLSFRGSYVPLDLKEGMTPLAHILDFDHTRRHEDHALMGGYAGEPIHPMIVTGQLDKGRMLYIAAALDAMCYRFGCKDNMEVLLDAVLWAARDAPPLKADCPPSVEIVTHLKPDRLLILLLNQSTNQLKPYPVVRYVLPVHNVQLALEIGDKIPASVETVTGAPAQWRKENDRLFLSVEELQEYEGIMIDF